MQKNTLKTNTDIKQIIRNLSGYDYIDANKIQKSPIVPLTKEKNNILNRDTLQIGAVFIGNYEGKDHKCIIGQDGTYVVNEKQYKTLSEAAKAITQVRTEGWRFWKIYSKGPSVLDVFRQKQGIEYGTTY